MPTLRAAGFDVVAEEPDTCVLRELDFARYPAVRAPGHTPHPAERLRLWARGGQVTPAEAEFVNAEFDAIMVFTRPEVAIAVRRWFTGTVLFRYFGNLPVLPEASLAPRDSDGWRGVVGVPIFERLCSSEIGISIEQNLVLRSTIPAAPEAARRQVSEQSVVGVYLQGVSHRPEVQDWVRGMVQRLGSARLLLFGVPGADTATFARMGPTVELVPRLGHDAYWATFARCAVMLYPHDDPMHSHYIPFEAIQCGIPALVLDRTPIAVESVESGSADGGDVGVFRNLGDVAGRVGALLNDAAQRAELVARQRRLLEPFSDRTIDAQARSILARVEADRAERRRPAKAPAHPPSIPSTEPLRTVRWRDPGVAVGVAPPSIAGPLVVGSSWPATVAEDAAGDLGRLRLAFPGADMVLKLGAPPVTSSDGAGLVAVTLETTGPEPVPATVEVVHGDRDPRYVAMRTSRADGDGARWMATAVVSLAADRALRIHVLSPLAPADCVLERVLVEGGAEGAPADEPTVTRVESGEPMPLWTCGRSAPLWAGLRMIASRRPRGSRLGTTPQGTRPGFVVGARIVERRWPIPVPALVVVGGRTLFRGRTGRRDNELTVLVGTRRAIMQVTLEADQQ